MNAWVVTKLKVILLSPIDASFENLQTESFLLRRFCRVTQSTNPQGHLGATQNDQETCGSQKRNKNSIQAQLMQAFKIF